MRAQHFSVEYQEHGFAFEQDVAAAAFSKQEFASKGY
jgi:hypothetical protein